MAVDTQRKPIELPKFLRQEPSIPTIEEAKRVFDIIDAAFAIDSETRTNDTLKTYFQTQYAGSKTVQGMRDANPNITVDKDVTMGESFLTSEGEDDSDIWSETDESSDDLVITEEEKQEMAAMLMEGANNAKNLSVDRILDLPPSIAKVVQDGCWIFRRAWREGHAPSLERHGEDINKIIQGLNIEEKRQRMEYQIPFRSIFALIPVIRSLAFKWATDRALTADNQVSKDKNAELARDITLQALTMISMLARFGVSWKSVITQDVEAAMAEIFVSGGLQLGKEMSLKVQDYLELDSMKPASFQSHIMEKAKEPLAAIFRSAEANDTEGVKNAFAEVVKFNNELQTANRSMSFKFNDHLLPMDVVKKFVLSAQRATEEARAQVVIENKAYLAGFLDRTGWETLAVALVEKDELKTLELPDKIQRVVKRQLLQFRFPIDEEYDRNRCVQELGEEPLSEASSAVEAQDSTVEESKAVPVKEVDNAVADETGFYPRRTRRPVYNSEGITPLGKIVAVQKAGRDAYRCIVNVGSPAKEVYKIVKASEFGRGMGERLIKMIPPSKPTDLSTRSSSHIEDMKCIVEVEQKPGAKNEPITKILVVWDDSVLKDGDVKEEWLTRSQLIILCGKSYMERERASLLAEWHANVNYLERMKQQGKHPDTKLPLDEAQRDEYPWLYPIEVIQERKGRGKGGKMERSQENATKVGKTAHIKVGLGRYDD